MASKDGKIVFENTLDARLDVAFGNKLPEVRFRLPTQQKVSPKLQKSSCHACIS